MSIDDFEKYLNLCYRYLSIRSRSEKEIHDYLSGKKVEVQTIEKIVERLKQQKFLNDESFARSWVLQRARLRPKGKRVLQLELKQKGIAREIIEKVLTEEQEDLPDELTQARTLIEKRIQKLKGKPRQEIYQKVGSFLSRRGFEWDLIKRSIDAELTRD